MIQIGDPIEYGGDRGRIIQFDDVMATAEFWEDKDYHMHTWNTEIPIDRAEILVHNTKVQIERAKKQFQETRQRDAAKKLTKVVFRLPSYYLICHSCEIVLEYNPMNVEHSWADVECVYCCECGQAMRVGG